MARLPHDTAIDIEHYRSSNKGMILRPAAIAFDDIRLDEDMEPFAYTRYATEIHRPQPLYGIPTSGLDGVYQRCLDMPLRLAGDKHYQLPEEWVGLAPLIEHIIGIEHRHNQNWRDYHTYLTVDATPVDAFAQQRHGGLHVDGFQGERIAEKTRMTRNYVASNNGGTRFYPQRFVVADPAVFNVFQGFDIQADSWIEAEERVVHFMDALTVHESGYANRPGHRTFFRLTWDIKPFDRLGNTHNSLIDYNWDMVKRDVHQEVRTPNYTDLEQSPYMPDGAGVNGLSTNKEPLLIGITGKPGSGKNHFSFKIIQELRHQGYRVHKGSLAYAVNEQMTALIDSVKIGRSVDDIAHDYGIDYEPAQQLHELLNNDVGTRNPEWGYDRRNQYVRQGLSQLALIRREQDVDYWLTTMLSTIPADVDVVVFTDMRFPNETDYVNNQGGITIRANVSPGWVAATTTVHAGYKYAEVGMNDPTETALDEYNDFYAQVRYEFFDGRLFTKNMLRHVGLPVPRAD